MSWVLIWQSVGVIVFGTLLLRIAGRKSISQMTMAQVIVMIGLGTLIIQPITDNGYWPTFLLAAVLVVVMILMEYLEIKSNGFETFITGKAVIVIEDGQLIEGNFKIHIQPISSRLMMLHRNNLNRPSMVLMLFSMASFPFWTQIPEYLPNLKSIAGTAALGQSQ